METSTALASSLAQHPKLRHRHARNFPAVLLPSTLTILGLLVYITVVATLSGTHVSPIGGLGCALREKWQSMFHEKNAGKIKRIQDAFDCCGLRSVRDMPFPFPGHGVTVDTCSQRFDRQVGCESAWRDKERTVAGLMIGVAVGVFVWVVRRPVHNHSPLTLTLTIGYHHCDASIASNMGPREHASPSPRP
jgi:hypothetical protein